MDLIIEHHAQLHEKLDHIIKHHPDIPTYDEPSTWADTAPVTSASADDTRSENGPPVTAPPAY